METLFYIYDRTSNSPSIAFVFDESGEIIHTNENCMNFPTQEQANTLIKEKGWESWAGVIEF